MLNKKLLLTLVLAALIAAAGTIGVLKAAGMSSHTLQTESVAAQSVSSEITADGEVHSESEATLHFQIGGLLTSLPFKTGDTVTVGQTIAQLDTYALQKQAEAAANAYQSAQDATAQTQENQQAGVIEGQQRTSLDTTNKNGYSTTTEAQVITDAVKRIVDQSQLTQNTAAITVQIAEYAQQLATLQAPFSGVITHMDVTTPKVNVTPATTFSIADPTALVFRANVSASDIDFVSTGSIVTIHIDGNSHRELKGTVERIYPTKTTLTSGEDVYQVDIVSDELPAIAKLGQTGSVTIESNTDESTSLVPSWTVLSNSRIWVMTDSGPVLRSVVTGKTHANMTEITAGLMPNDRIITNPKSLGEQHYSIL